MDEESPKKLSDLFNDGWELFRDIEGSEEASNSEILQNKITECIRCFVRCTHMVNLLTLFSSNEVIDEMSTENIKFLLLPAFLGELCLKVITDDRKTAVLNANVFLLSRTSLNVLLNNKEVYFQDFIKRCHEYKATSKDLSCYLNDPSEEKQKKSLDEMNKSRQEKIERYKESKELNETIKILQKRLKEDPDSVNEDQARMYYLDWVRLWINNSIENKSALKTELEILEHMNKLRQGTVKPPAPSKQLKPLKPVLITREMIKKGVFGTGSRCMPTMTEDEYFEKELREGKIVMDFDSKNTKANKKSEEDDEARDSADEENEETLQKARAWDDFKDTHRRGDGNKERHG